MGLHTELVCFGPKPGEFWTSWSMLSGANSILPVIGSDEIASWVPNHGDVELSERGEDVSAVTMGV